MLFHGIEIRYLDVRDANHRGYEGELHVNNSFREDALRNIVYIVYKPSLLVGLSIEKNSPKYTRSALSIQTCKRAHVDYTLMYRLVLHLTGARRCRMILLDIAQQHG